MAAEEEVSYEPRSVKAVLRDMKDLAELLIDLSYSAVLFDNEDLAAEVLELESEMDVLQLQARMSLVMAGRNPDEAEQLAPIFGIVGAAEKISDAAGDIAKVVLDESGLPQAVYGSLPEAVETLARATVVDGSRYADQTLGELDLETETGVRVIAIRREHSWLLDPGPSTTIQPDDVVLCRGSEEAVAAVYETLTGEPFSAPPIEPPSIDDLERAVESVVLMKNMSELAVDLAYGSVLFDDADLAAEVQQLEVEVDGLQSRFEVWALRAASQVEDPVSIRGLLHIAASTEVISDAALEISEGVLRGLGSHPVVAAAVEEAEEAVISVDIDPESPLIGQTVEALRTRTGTGVQVIAIRRSSEGETEWLLSPDADTEIQSGDAVIAKGSRTGTDRLSSLASG